MLIWKLDAWHQCTLSIFIYCYCRCACLFLTSLFPHIVQWPESCSSKHEHWLLSGHIKQILLSFFAWFAWCDILAGAWVLVMECHCRSCWMREVVFSKLIYVCHNSTTLSCLLFNFTLTVSFVRVMVVPQLEFVVYNLFLLSWMLTLSICWVDILTTFWYFTKESFLCCFIDSYSDWVLVTESPCFVCFLHLQLISNLTGLLQI